MEIPDRTGPVPDWHVFGAVKAGIRVHTENDKVYQKKCSKCGNRMMGALHLDVNLWAFQCERGGCGGEEFLDTDGRAGHGGYLEVTSAYFCDMKKWREENKDRR